MAIASNTAETVIRSMHFKIRPDGTWLLPRDRMIMLTIDVKNATELDNARILSYDNQDKIWRLPRTKEYCGTSKGRLKINIPDKVDNMIMNEGRASGRLI